MTFEFRNQLAAALEARMRNLYETLSEKDRRRFAAIPVFINLGVRPLENLGNGHEKYAMNQT